ncbi:MFS transporter [Microtetraspora sp. NBRC 16547]|uniref:MFS transporter n=1 Tax=Microtetraspora sp. NBRC 16547 TaxID=3030993 RepID=UPI0024A4BD16|nr:MFS transporter [Microtetraspora sp. NBRC 16547]GLW98474.1 MFS transporter [Microtetraspora sp. NBRC 16547]
MSHVPKAGRREWAGLAVLTLPTLLVALDINSLFLALPHLSADLRTSGTEQLWITDIYGFMVAGLVVTMGTLGDRIGRRRLLMIGGAAFCLTSLLAAFSVSPAMLIGARALLGVAGATLMPSTLALIGSMFRDARQRGTAIAVWATCQFAGAALGPVVGGVLLEHFWWGSVFLLAVPVMVLLLLAGPFLLPEFRNPAAGRLDLAGVVLSLLAILPIVYGIKRLAATGAGPSVVPLTAIIMGAAFAVAFGRRQMRLDDPILDLRLFARRSFRLVLAALALAGVAMAGIGLLVTQYLQSVQGFAPAEAALWFAPMGLAVALGTTLTPVVVRSVSPATAIAGGLALSAAGAGLLAVVTRTAGDGQGPVLIVVGIAVLALGTGPLFALGTDIVVGSVPPERGGSAAAMSETSNYLGGTLGVAVLGTVGAALYRDRMAGAVPARVPAEAARLARETVAGANGAAAALPPDDAARLLRAAHDAFTGGLVTVGLIGAVLFAFLAALMTRLPRRPGHNDGEQEGVVQDGTVHDSTVHNSTGHDSTAYGAPREPAPATGRGRGARRDA